MSSGAGREADWYGKLQDGTHSEYGDVGRHIWGDVAYHDRRTEGQRTVTLAGLPAKIHAHSAEVRCTDDAGCAFIWPDENSPHLQILRENQAAQVKKAEPE